MEYVSGTTCQVCGLDRNLGLIACGSCISIARLKEGLAVITTGSDSERITNIYKAVKNLCIAAKCERQRVSIASWHSSTKYCYIHHCQMLGCTDIREGVKLVCAEHYIQDIKDMTKRKELEDLWSKSIRWYNSLQDWEKR